MKTHRGKRRLWTIASITLAVGSLIGVVWAGERQFLVILATSPKEFGGHVLPFTRNETVIEPPYPNPHGFQVTITVPLQPSVHGNSTGVFLDIFRSD